MNLLDKNNLDKFYNSNETDQPTGLLVTDKEGNILICNSFFALTTGTPREELLKLKLQDLVKKGNYDKSTSLKAIETNQVVTDIVTTQIGLRVLSISTPVLDSFRKATLVITSSRLLDIDSYSAEEKKTIARIKKDEANQLKEISVESESIVAEDIQMKRIIQVCNQIARFDSKVLLFGESGTGKDVFANYIHKISKRKDASFISVNCAAIPEALFESELFGHEKGSFTGAAGMKQGLIEVANGGTLFLDEISEMPLELQVKLLRVLELQEFRRVGGTETFKSDFRLICATNRDLKKMVEEGKFRQDLYYRIGVVPIIIPPLRERKLDILALANRFIRELNKQYDLEYQLEPEQINYLLSYKWPGNVRELKNYIENTVVINNHFYMPGPEAVGGSNQYCFIPYNQSTDLKQFLADAEKTYINKVLNDCEGKVGEAALKLGIHRSALYRKLKTYEDEQ